MSIELGPRPEEMMLPPAPEAEVAKPERRLGQLTVEDVELFERYSQLANLDELSPEEQTMYGLLTIMYHGATTDELTRLRNRKAFNLEIERDRRREREADKPRDVILFVDVNDFKKVNTEYHHEGGDRVLQAIADGMAAEIEESLRSNDAVFRIAGDEFCIILREAGLNGAAVVAERLYNRIAATPIELTNQAGETENYIPRIGIGYAEVEDSMQDAIQRADDALMTVAKAKKGYGMPSIAYHGEEWTPPETTAPEVIEEGNATDSDR